MENNNQTTTTKKNNPIVLIILVILIIAIVGYGVWQSSNKKDDMKSETTTISTTAETTLTTTEPTTQTTTITTTTTTTVKPENEYYQVLPNTVWTYYFGEHDQTSILEFYDNNTLRYYHIDGELSEITSEMHGKYEMNGNNFTVHNSDTGEIENYTIKISISDKNNLHGMDFIKISGTGTIIPVEYYYG